MPRKSADTFQKDLYPDTYAGIPALTADQWAAGQNATPAKKSMKPGAAGAASAASSSSSAAAPALKVSKSPADLQRELDAANAKIAALEAELAKLKA